jgi:hypothetical protein
MPMGPPRECICRPIFSAPAVLGGSSERGSNRSGWRENQPSAFLDQIERELLVDVTSGNGSAARKRAMPHREAILAPLNTSSGKRVNSFRPRFMANNGSRPLHKQAALEAQALACPFGRPLSNEAVRCVPLVGLDARPTSCGGLMRSCVRLSPSRLRFSPAVGVAICIPEDGRSGCTASLPAFAPEDAP